MLPSRKCRVQGEGCSWERASGQASSDVPHRNPSAGKVGFQLQVCSKGASAKLTTEVLDLSSAGEQKTSPARLQTISLVVSFEKREEIYITEQRKQRLVKG